MKQEDDMEKGGGYERLKRSVEALFRGRKLTGEDPAELAHDFLTDPLDLMGSKRCTRLDRILEAYDPCKGRLASLVARSAENWLRNKRAVSQRRGAGCETIAIVENDDRMPHVSESNGYESDWEWYISIVRRVLSEMQFTFSLADILEPDYRELSRRTGKHEFHIRTIVSRYRSRLREAIHLAIVEEGEDPDVPEISEVLRLIANENAPQGLRGGKG